MTESHHFLLPSCFLIIIIALISGGVLSGNSLSYQRVNNDTTIMTDDNNHGVFIEDISTEPKTVHLGDSFNMVVTLINSSPNTIYFPLSKCLGKPVSLIFTTNNVKKLTTICRADAPVLSSTTPKERSIINSAIYKAVSAGSAEGIVTIYYRITNNGPFSIPVSKAFSFQIEDNNRMLP